MDLFESVEKRRSVRSLVKTKISMEELEKIVDAGRLAPSGMNVQPREFIIITDPDLSVENMLLAITALGYNSCWVEGTLLRIEAQAKELLGIPENKRLIVVLPIGKAASPGSQASKKPMSDVTYYNRYGKRKT